MALSDVLDKIGEGAEDALKTTGRVASVIAPALGKGIVNEEAGYAPQIAAEGRAHQQKLEDAQLAAKEQELTTQLETGRKYGTLTPEQQAQYVDQITQLYSHPRHAGTLMEKLRQAVHPNGAVAGPAPKLADAAPPGGTAAADERRAEQLAQAKLAAKPKKDFDVYLDKYIESHGLGSVDAITDAQYEDALQAYGKAKRAEKMTTKVIQDPDSPTHFSAATWDLTTGQLVSKFPGVLPPRGFIPTDRVTRTTDQFGNVTESVSQMTPQIPGAQSPPTHPEPPKPSAAPKASPPAAPKSTPAKGIGGIIGKVNPARPEAPRASSNSPRALDASGHIPASAGNSQLVEAANELLDGRDLKDIPAKAKAPAAALARQYGWEQGTFTPREKIQVNEAANFLQRLQDSPSLGVLDSPLSRGKIAQALRSTEKQGVMGTQLTQLVSQNLTPEESEFVRLYNAAAGTVSGLAPLTRGGRPVESSIRRLMQELPNVLQSSGSADAKERVKNLLQEIKVAEATKGNTPLGGSPASALGGPVDVYVRDANGKLVLQSGAK